MFEKKENKIKSSVKIYSANDMNVLTEAAYNIGYAEGKRDTVQTDDSSMLATIGIVAMTIIITGCLISITASSSNHQDTLDGFGD